MAGLIVAIVATILAVGGIMLTYFIERSRKPIVVASAAVPPPSLLDTTETDIVLSIIIQNKLTNSWPNWANQQSARETRVRIDIIDGNSKRLTTDEFGNEGIDLSLIELPQGLSSFWKLASLPCPRVTKRDLVPGRRYLIPVAYKVNGDVNSTLLDLHDKREGKLILPEGQHNLSLSITGEGVDSKFHFILSNKGHSFHTFNLRSA